MAYKSSFDADGGVQLKFLAEDLRGGQDEVDARSRHVLDFATAWKYPRYVLHKDYFPQKEETVEYRAEKLNICRLRKISQRKEFSRSLHSGLLSLLTTEPLLGKQEAERVGSILSDIHSGSMYRVLYLKDNMVVVYMSNGDAFNTIGSKILMNNGLGIIPDKRITTFEVIESVPNYYLELASASVANKMCDQYSQSLVNFCSSFKYLRILADSKQEDALEQKPCSPSICLTLMFSKVAHQNAKKIGEQLRENPAHWRSSDNTVITTAPGEVMFVPHAIPGPMLGLKTNCPFPGVRFSITFAEKLQQMEKFYECITGVRGMPREDGDTSYRTYSVARNVELQLVHNSSVKVQTVNNLRLCIRIADQQNLSSQLQQPMTCVGPGQWETIDPVGTTLVLFTVAD